MGMIVRKGNLYGGGGGDDSVVITYEEFLNLSEEEKASNTTYFITDYPGSDIPSPGSGGGDNIVILDNKWELIGSTVGTTPLVADFSKYDELLISVSNSNDTSNNVTVMNILTSSFVEGKNNFFQGGSYISQSSNTGAVVYGTLEQLQLAAFQSNTNTLTSTAEMTIHGMVYGGTVDPAVIVDNLESTDSEAALSANMGRQLKEDMIMIPTEGRTKIANDIASDYEWIATDNCWLNVTGSAQGSGYLLVVIYNGEILVNSSQLASSATKQYADTLTLPVKKGQKVKISYINYKSITLVMCK